MQEKYCFSPALGDVGHLNYPDGTVGAVPYTFRVVQVIGPDQMLIKTGQKLTMVKGIGTDGLVDDQYVKLDQAMRVTGTETYETAIGGTKTVFVIEPYDLTEFQRWIPQLQKTLWRRWTDAGRKHSVIARLVTCSEETATLEKANGTRVELPIAKLSKEDQAFLK